MSYTLFFHSLWLLTFLDPSISIKLHFNLYLEVLKQHGNKKSSITNTIHFNFLFRFYFIYSISKHLFSLFSVHMRCSYLLIYLMFTSWMNTVIMVWATELQMTFFGVDSNFVKVLKISKFPNDLIQV